MKTKIMLGALITAAVIGSSVGVGYAGSAGGTAGGVFFFRCYMIQNGATQPPFDLSVDDVFTNPQNVHVGKARLLCTPAAADTVPVPDQFSFVDPAFVDQITCYDIPASQPPKDFVTLSDPLVGTQTVRLGPQAFVCIQSLCTGTTDKCFTPHP
jgi:hypothetical protein